MPRNTAPDLSPESLFGDEPMIEGEVAPEVNAEQQQAAPETPPEAASETPPAETPPTAEPPVEAAPEETPAPTEEEPPPPEHKGTKFPWKELREAQREREQLKAEIEAARQRDAQYRQAEYERQQQQQRPQQPQGEQRPGIDRPYTREELAQLRTDDPIEYATVLAEQAQRDAAAQEQRTQIMFMQQQVARQVDEFKSSHPDYLEAAKYAGDRERAAWVAVGLPDQVPPHNPKPDGSCCADHMVEARTAMLIHQSLQSGKNVAENVMAVAKAYGWQPTAQKVEAPPAPAPAPAILSPQEQVAASKAKTAASMGSIGNIPSGPSKSTPRISAEDFKAMSEKDMEKMDKENPNWMDYLDL